MLLGVKGRLNVWCVCALGFSMVDAAIPHAVCNLPTGRGCNNLPARKAYLAHFLHFFNSSSRYSERLAGRLEVLLFSKCSVISDVRL